MFAVKGIMAVSPHLGSSNIMTMTNFIFDRKAMMQMLS